MKTTFKYDHCWLYDEVKTTLQEHTSVNESTIKRCLLMYIEYLRSGDLKNISYVILNKTLANLMLIISGSASRQSTIR